jgi:hypothetical protein
MSISMRDYLKGINSKFELVYGGHSELLGQLLQ